MKQPSELKDIALSALRGNWGRAIVLQLVSFLACGVFFAVYFGALFSAAFSGEPSAFLAALPIIFFAYLLFFFFIVTYVFGTQMTFIDFVRGDNQALKVSDAFSFGFKNLGVIFLRLLYVFAWSLLLYIPGIIKYYSYAMTPYIVKDNPGISADAAIQASQELMRGHKLDLFVLQLTFIGWFFLAYFTCGIGFLFVVSYYQATEAAFYQNLLEESEVSTTTTSSTEVKF